MLVPCGPRLPSCCWQCLASHATSAAARKATTTDAGATWKARLRASPRARSSEVLRSTWENHGKPWGKSSFLMRKLWDNYWFYRKIMGKIVISSGNHRIHRKLFMAFPSAPKKVPLFSGIYGYPECLGKYDGINVDFISPKKWWDSYLRMMLQHIVRGTDSFSKKHTGTCLGGTQIISAILYCLNYMYIQMLQHWISCLLPGAWWWFRRQIHNDKPTVSQSNSTDWLKVMPSE